MWVDNEYNASFKIDEFHVTVEYGQKGNCNYWKDVAVGGKADSQKGNCNYWKKINNDSGTQQEQPVQQKQEAKPAQPELEMEEIDRMLAEEKEKNAMLKQKLNEMLKLAELKKLEEKKEKLKDLETLKAENAALELEIQLSN